MSVVLLAHGEGHDRREWGADEVPTIKVGREVLVEASARNCGDAMGQTAISNFVVPDGVALAPLLKRDVASFRVVEAENGIASLPPNSRVVYVAAERTWYPGLWWLHRFRLTANAVPPEDGKAHPSRNQ
jgi:hypothetical protein